MAWWTKDDERDAADERDEQPFSHGAEIHGDESHADTSVSRRGNGNGQRCSQHYGLLYRPSWPSCWTSSESMPHLSLRREVLRDTLSYQSWHLPWWREAPGNHSELPLVTAERS